MQNIVNKLNCTYEDLYDVETIVLLNSILTRQETCTRDFIFR